MEEMKNSLAPVAAGNEASLLNNLPSNTSTAPLRFRYPAADTLPALPLALMLQGRKVSTLSMTYSPLAATRLPAYIEKLRDLGLGETIVSRALPLTERQRKRKHAKPFHAYHLPPNVIAQLGVPAQKWAGAVLELWGVEPEDFPPSEDWEKHCEGEPS